MEASLVNPISEKGLPCPVSQRAHANPSPNASPPDPAWVRLLAPRSAQEAAMARRIAVASRHIWAFRLALTVEERMHWYRAFPDPMHVTAGEEGFAVSRTERAHANPSSTVHGIGSGKGGGR